MRTALYHRSEHLPEAKLTLPLSACVFCGARFSMTTLAKLQVSPDVFLLSCPKCYACTASRMPSESALTEYYSGYYCGPAQKITHDSPTRFARHVSSFVRLQKGNLSITDFGGGDGSLAYSLAAILCDRGCSSVQITVIDFAEGLASRDPRITIHSNRPGTPIPPSEIILASAVLEHLPDPLPALRDLFAALEPNGVLYIRTPAVAGFLKFAATFGRTLDFTFPAHLHDLGQRFWENILTMIPGGDEFEVLHSAPSLVETDFRQHPWHTLVAHVAKAPWRLLGRNYTLVGGWEIVFTRK